MLRSEEYLKQIIQIILLSLLLYGCTDYYLTPELQILYNKRWGGRKIFLTNISLYLTVIGLLIGYIKRYFKRNTTRKIYNPIIKTALGLESMIIILYWTLMSIDPRLLNPRIEPQYQTPLFPDMCMHTFPFIALIVECYTNTVKNDNQSFIYMQIFCISYFILAYIAAINNGKWPYPLLDRIHPLLRPIFFEIIGSMGFLIGCVIIKLIIYTKKRNNNK